MLYYKVKKEGDQKEYGAKGWFLVASELYTESEIRRRKIPESLVKNFMEPIQISKKQTYFFFGARFQNSAA